jgi:WD40 repeat protein
MFKVAVLLLALLLGLYSITSRKSVSDTKGQTATYSATSGVIISAENAEQVKQVARIGTGSANSLVLSPDGKTIALAGSLGVWLYGVDTSAAPARLLEGHTGGVWDVAFSPDSKLVASSSTDKTIRLWDVQSRKSIRTFQGDSQGVASIAFSPDGKLFASGGSEGTVNLWDVQSGHSKGTLSHGGYPSSGSLTFSSDSKMLAATIGYGAVIWDVPSGQIKTTIRVRRIPNDAGAGVFDRVMFSPDGKLLVSQAGEIMVWDVQSGQPKGTGKYYPGCGAVRFTSVGQLQFYGGCDGAVVALDLGTGERQTIFRVPSNRPSYGSLSQDGNLVVALNTYEGTISLWDIRSGQLKTTFAAPVAMQPQIAFSRDSSLLAFAGYDMKMRLYEVQGGKLKAISTEDIGWVADMWFSPDNSRMLSVSPDNSGWNHKLHWWDVPNGKLIETIAGPKVSMNPSTAVFSPDGKLLAYSSSSSQLSFWDIATRDHRQMASLMDHPSSIAGVAFSPDGRFVAAIGGDSTVLWDMQTLKRVGVYKGLVDRWVNGVAFIGDGKLLATSDGGNNVVLWDQLSTQSKTMFVGHTSPITNLDFSPDGKLLASGDRSGKIMLWDVQTGQRLTTLIGHTDAVNRVKFSPNGTLLASSGESTVRLWAVSGS